MNIRYEFDYDFLLAVGLGVDAFSVAIGIGAANQQKVVGAGFAAFPRFRSFSVCHAAYRLAGRFDGGRYEFRLLITGLLLRSWLLVGGKMIWEGFEKESDEQKTDQTRGWPLFLLSIATSIDALAVGFSFSLLKTAHLISGGDHRCCLFYDDGSRYDFRQRAGADFRQESGDSGRSGFDRYRREDTDGTYRLKAQGPRITPGGGARCKENIPIATRYPRQRGHKKG